MIQDSINQLLAMSAVGTKLAEGAITNARNQEFDTAKQAYLNKKEEFNEKADQKFQEYKNNGMGHAPDITNLEHEIETGSELENLKQAADKASQRRLFPDKATSGQVQELQRDLSADIHQQRMKLADEEWRKKAELKAKQADKLKEVKKLLEGRHSKGEKQREALKILNEGGK